MQLRLTQAGRSIRLGRELGSGGEGSVFTVDELPAFVAKLYSSPPKPEKVHKLSSMIAGRTEALLKIAAWPTDLLADTKGVVRGFVMPRISARRDIHELYSPKSRTEAFPEADFLFIVHVTGNIARAFAVVHDLGHVIGDVNHGNLLVGSDGTVMLIDCDSFQVRNGAAVFTCDVGVPLFTPPELQGQMTFRGLVRTPNHDLFGLSVLAFHLLFMGRHPFAGRFVGHGEMPIERAIAEYRFAYAPNAIANGMERPPGTVPLETVSAEIAQLFLSSFGRQGSNGMRPGAKVWIDCLERFKQQLKMCSLAPWHHYPTGLAACPWCTLERQTGVRLFGQRIVVGFSTGVVDLSAIWRAIVAVPHPGEDPQLPSEHPWKPPSGVSVPSPLPKQVRTAVAWALIGAGFVGCTWALNDVGMTTVLILYALAWIVWPRVSAEQRMAASRAHAEAKSRWMELTRRWQQEASRATFEGKLAELKTAREALADLPNERRRRIAKLETEREVRQKHRYLDRFRIDRASIRGIGPGRTAMLASYGIETATDLDYGTILQIPGFGETLTSELLRWKQFHERNFRFNPKEPIDPRDIQNLDQELGEKRRRLLDALRSGTANLQRMRQEILSARSRLMPVLEQAWANLKIAEAHLNAI